MPHRSHSQVILAVADRREHIWNEASVYSMVTCAGCRVSRIHNLMMLTEWGARKKSWFIYSLYLVPNMSITTTIEDSDAAMGLWWTLMDITLICHSVHTILFLGLNLLLSLFSESQNHISLFYDLTGSYAPFILHSLSCLLMTFKRRESGISSIDITLVCLEYFSFSTRRVHLVPTE